MTDLHRNTRILKNNRLLIFLIIAQSKATPSSVYLQARGTLAAIFKFLVEFARGAVGEDWRSIKVVIVKGSFLFWVELVVVGSLGQHR